MKDNYDLEAQVALCAIPFAILIVIFVFGGLLFSFVISNILNMTGLFLGIFCFCGTMAMFCFSLAICKKIGQNIRLKQEEEKKEFYHSPDVKEVIPKITWKVTHQVPKQKEWFRSTWYHNLNRRYKERR